MGKESVALLIELAETELPLLFQNSFSYWKDIFRVKVSSKPFTTIDFKSKDKNLLVHSSLEEYIKWFSSSKSYNGMSYSKELTFLLNAMNPKIVVEFGTGVGIGTFMISRLCEPAMFYTVDTKEKVTVFENTQVDTGHIAKMNNVKTIYITEKTFEIVPNRVDFCFINVGCNKEYVYLLSQWAWRNRNRDKFLIVWHNRVWSGEFKESVRSFSEMGQLVYRLKGSGTAWVYKV